MISIGFMAFITSPPGGDFIRTDNNLRAGYLQNGSFSLTGAV